MTRPQRRAIIGRLRLLYGHEASYARGPGAGPYLGGARLGGCRRAAVGRLGGSGSLPLRMGRRSRRPALRGRSGKGVRSTLALLSAEAVGAAAEVALPGAVAVELIHNFSLVHDDIIDADAERRHRATMWKVFGVGDAIIVGDALMVLAFELLLDEVTPARTAAAADLARATAEMIAGQHMDMSLNSLDTVDVDRCWEMVSRKTGALWPTPVLLGRYWRAPGAHC